MPFLGAFANDGKEATNPRKRMVAHTTVGVAIDFVVVLPAVAAFGGVSAIIPRRSSRLAVPMILSFYSMKSSYYRSKRESSINVVMRAPNRK